MLVTTLGLSQNNSKWIDNLSYRETFDLSISGSEIIVASEFGVFIFDEEDDSISKMSKINGLLGERITSIKTLDNVDAFVVGYETGDFSIVFSNGRVLHVNDIRNSGVPGDKKINSISEHGYKIYLGTTFGIVEYNIVKEQFGDAFYFGANGDYIYVNDIAFLNDYIFVATDTGVYRADITNPFLVDFNQWKLQNIGTIPQSEFNSIAEINGVIIANNSEVDTKQYMYKNSVWSLKHQYSNVVKVKSSKEYITYSAGDNVYVFDKDLQLNQSINKKSLGALATIKKDNITWFASRENGLTKKEGIDSFTYIMPDGPDNNNPFKIKASPEKLYVIYGAYSNGYAPKGRNMGYDIFDNKEWRYIKPSVFSNVRDLVDVAIDPNDSDHIYISSWGKGILEMQDNEKAEMWVEENTNYNIQKLFYAPSPDYVSIRIGGSVFDKEGNLWVANGWNVDRPFVVRKNNGGWDSFGFDKGVTDNGMSGITIDENGNKWIGTRNSGIWIYNEGDSFDSTGDDKTLCFTTSENSGNLPSNRVNTIAIDKENNAWIGTGFGLVVFSDIENMFESDYFNAEPIVINDNGVEKELLSNETINKIAVDGANNKWFATGYGGVYFVSPNGQKIIHHFTKENSPLFSNQVLDLDIDHETGVVYFVTSKGLVSFIGADNLVVNNGSSDKIVGEPVIVGLEVTITADSDEGKVFDKWIAVPNEVVFEDSKSSTTKFNMIAEEVVITATYEGDGLSVDDDFDALVNVYPNPVINDVLNINTVGGFTSSVSITNSMGQKVFTADFKGNSTQVSTSSFDKGLYLVTITNGTNISTKGIIIK